MEKQKNKKKLKFQTVKHTIVLIQRAKNWDIISEEELLNIGNYIIKLNNNVFQKDLK